MSTNVTSVAIVNSTGAFTALSGPTVASSDNSTNAATTAWAKFGFAASLGTNGYLKFPAWLGGFTLQWGTAFSLANNSPTSVGFNIAFATAALAVVANDNSSFATGGNPRTMGCTISSTSTFTILANGSGASAFWIAVGY